MNKIKFAIIGAGNMGASIAEGFLKTGRIPAQNIYITDLRQTPLDHFTSLGLRAGTSNHEAIEFADTIIIAVKPHFVKSVLSEIKHLLNPGKIIVSIAAGITISEIEEKTGKLPIFRVMPNTAIAIQESMTCIAEANTTKEQQDQIGSVFNLLGKTVFIPEDMITAATVLGSCGTAYALRYLRASIEGGVEMGFTPEMAKIIASQTTLGAAKLLLQNGSHPEVEIDKVTTPKGITIAGLNEMEHYGFSSSIIRGLMRAFDVRVKI